MEKIEIQIPEGKEAIWRNGVIMIVDKPKEKHIYKVGDKAKVNIDIKVGTNVLYKDTEVEIVEAESKFPNMYRVVSDNMSTTICGYDLTPIPRDITERIKTFEDACKWCNHHGKGYLTSEYDAVNAWFASNIKASLDLLCYLKLRIITYALNEGWEPTYNRKETRYCVNSNLLYTNGDIDVMDTWLHVCIPKNLFFKTKKLAEYAASQFEDIYKDYLRPI